MKSKYSKVPFDFIGKLIQTPDVLVRTIRALIRRRIYYSTPLGNNPNKAHLEQISIKITNACNLRCKMCAQWGEKGYNFDKPTSVIKETVPLAVYKKMVDDVAHLKPFVYIWGGEPFMYPDLMPLMRYMKEKNIIFSVVTNGTWLKENAEEIVDAGWDALMLSLDGPKHIHDSIRGKEGTFDTLMEGIQAVKEEKAKRNSIKPYIMMLSTTTKDNAAYLSEIFQAAEDCGADCLVSYYAWFTTQEIGDAHQRIMMERLGVRAEAWKGYLYSFDEIDTKILQENVDKVKNTKWKIPYVMIPDLTIEQIPIYYKEVDNFFGYNKCTAPWLAAELMPNGDVSTCRDYPDYITGNIQEEGILEIFHGEKFNKFRKTLRDVGMFPICARCCGLMGF